MVKEPIKWTNLRSLTRFKHNWYHSNQIPTCVKDSNFILFHERHIAHVHCISRLFTGQARVGIIGSGGLGIWAIQFLKALYPSASVVAIDVSVSTLTL